MNPPSTGPTSPGYKCESALRNDVPQRKAINPTTRLSEGELCFLHCCVYIYICIYGPVSRVPIPPMGWGGYDAPVVVYIHTYLHTYLPTYIPTYIHTYIPLHYLTLHYLTLHYLTLHSIHTYIPAYQHTNIPPPQATGGGTRRTIPPPQATGGGDQKNHTTTTGHRGGDQKNQAILSTHTHWWGGRGGGQRCTIYICIHILAYIVLKNINVCIYLTVYCYIYINICMTVYTYIYI